MQILIHTCLNMRPINLILFFNYFYTVFKQYKGYWLLILPYNYDIRSLSVWCSRRSMSENIIKYNYKQMEWGKICFKLFKWEVSGLQGLCGVSCCIFGFILLLYISMNMNNITENNNNNITNITNEIEIINKASYPSCDLKWYCHLSVIDLTSLAHMTYDIGDREIEYNILIQEQICVYFDRKLSSECSSKVINYTKEEPVYIHLRHELNKIDVIAIRGTKLKLDTVQEFSLFNQVASVDGSSTIVPITTSKCSSLSAPSIPSNVSIMYNVCGILVYAMKHIMYILFCQFVCIFCVYFSLLFCLYLVLDCIFSHYFECILIIYLILICTHNIFNDYVLKSFISCPIYCEFMLLMLKTLN